MFSSFKVFGMKNLILYAFLLFFSHLSYSQSIISVDNNSIKPEGKRLISPEEYFTFKVNHNEVYTILSQAPHENSTSLFRSSAFVKLPMADGQVKLFHVIESPIFEEGLQRKFPNYKTFKIGLKGDPSVHGRLDITPYGIHYSIRSKEGMQYLDPLTQHNTQYIQTYYRKNLKNIHQFSCESTDFEVNQPHNHQGIINQDNQNENEDSFDDDFSPMFSPVTSENTTPGGMLRTYRLALATTGEYSQFHGGTQASTLAAMTTTMNRVNEVYEIEISVRLILIANTNTLIELDGTTDPYTNGTTNVMINESQTEITNVIGTANFDIGHLFGTNSGGLAGLGVVCSPNSKARGVTGSGAPVGDAFDIDYVAHEMGHQFGATHTFNNSCSGNRTAATAYEPGSGSTIMAYANICPPNLQSASDPYFHIASLENINNLINNSATCYDTIINENVAPITDAGNSGYVIPVSTPFELIGSATDANGDALTFCWEEFDLSPNVTNLANPSGNEPIFRSWNPMNGSTRVFPRINDLVNNTTSVGEILPTYTRGMTFRLTTRDNNPDGGAASFNEVTITSNTAAGPFILNAPNGGQTVAENSNLNITWDVANTHVAPVNSPSVDITLSLDGGFTYPITLATGVDNDGQHQLTLPINIVPAGQTQVTTARLKVKSSNNIFFDISNANFTITKPEFDDFIFVANDSNLAVCSGDTLNFSVNIQPVLNFDDTVTITTGNIPTGVIINLDTNLAEENENFGLQIIPDGATSGNYSFDIYGVSDTITDTLNIPFTISTAIPLVTNLIFPGDEATNVALGPVHTWNTVDQAVTYDIQVALDSNFTNIVHNANITDTFWTPNPIYNNLVTYFWRVRAKNACGEAAWTEEFEFITTDLGAVFGCTDTSAFNYNPAANVDDGSCVPKIFGCINPDAINFNPTANTDDGSCIIEGCTNPAATNYNPDANQDDGSCTIFGCTDSTAFNYNPDANVNDGSCVPKIFGCTDSNAINFDATANTDNGTCISFVHGCMDSNNVSYNPMANYHVQDSCSTSGGCTDPSFNNYDPTATIDDGSCSNDTIFYHYDMHLDSIFRMRIEGVPGVHIQFVNWQFGDGNNGLGNPIDHYYPNDGVYAVNALAYDSLSTTTFELDTNLVVDLRGCTNPVMQNYSYTAIIDDGSCIPHVFGCTNPVATNYNPNATFNDNSCIINGCTDTNSVNYNPDATVNDGTCIPKVFGCTDSTAFNYNPDANVDNGSCVPVIMGCLDSTAFNYNASANTDDGSCVPVVYGCIDTLALNFNSSANTDDQSCSYDPSTSTFWDVIITSENHTILVPDTTEIIVNGANISNGDVLGVFYPNADGNLRCGGKVTWTGSSVTISAYGNDLPSDNGFDDNEEFVWKVFNSTDSLTYDLLVDYNTTMPDSQFYKNDGISAVRTMVSGGTHSIDLVENWNFVSTNVIPTTNTTQSVFNDISGSIDLVKDELGNVFWPAFNIDNIDSLTVGKAYKIKTTGDITWVVEGSEVNPSNHPLSLPQGWSYLGYLRRNPANIMNVLSDISTDIFVVKDGQGNVYWPGFGINNIGNMEKGKGYQINMTNASTFTFPSNSVALPVMKMASIEKPSYFISPKPNMENMHIGFKASAIEFTIKAKDEFGVFNQEDELVGSGLYEEENLVISIFETADSKNDILRLKHYDSKKQKVEDVLVNGKEEFEFEKDMIYVANKLSKKANFENTLHPIVHVDGSEITIEINNEKVLGKMSLYNTLGQKLWEGASNSSTSVINDISLEKGVYYIMMENHKHKIDIVIK
jgi:hypothetical protein